MKFGVSTFVWVSPFNTASFDLVRKVKDMGYDIIEIAVEDKDIIDWVKLKKLTDEVGLSITISGAFGAERDIASDNPEFRRIGLTYIKDCVQIANEMGSPVFGGPIYSAVGKTRLVSEEQKKKERNWCIENLFEAAKFAEQYNVVLGLEPLNRFETDMINTGDQALSLIREVDSPYLKILLDTFHCNIEEKSIPDTIRKIGKDLCHVQGNESDRGTPGTGNLDWQGIKKALIDIQYTGSIVVETFGAPSKELARAASIWRPLANSADELASEGLAFYKEMFSA